MKNYYAKHIYISRVVLVLFVSTLIFFIGKIVYGLKDYPLGVLIAYCVFITAFTLFMLAVSVNFFKVYFTKRPLLILYEDRIVYYVSLTKKEIMLKSIKNIELKNHLYYSIIRIELVNKINETIVLRDIQCDEQEVFDSIYKLWEE